MVLREPLRVGPLRVATAPGAVRAFRRETGWDELDGPPPASFPVIWLREKAIGEIFRAAALDGGAPVHESQRFDYEIPLETGRTYELMVVLRREDEPSRLIVEGEISDLDGRRVGSLVSVMRLVDLGAAS
jgi:hypothetical protein